MSKTYQVSPQDERSVFSYGNVDQTTVGRGEHRRAVREKHDMRGEVKIPRDTHVKGYLQDFRTELAELNGLVRQAHQYADAGNSDRLEPLLEEIGASNEILGLVGVNEFMAFLRSRATDVQDGTIDGK